MSADDAHDRGPRAGTPAQPDGTDIDDDVRVAAVRELLVDICTASDARVLAARWGDITDDDGRDRVRIACAPGAPFESLSITAWPAVAYGVVDVALRGAPWPKMPFDRAFGPFEATAQFDEGPGRVVATWSVERAPATALLQLWLAADGVAAITIRRDPRQPG